MERTLPKVFYIYPLLWTVFFPHGRHSFYIIQVEKDLAVLYCNYYRSWTTASTHPSIHKNSVMVPHGSLTTNYTNVHKNPYIIENNFNSYVLYRNLNTWSPTVPESGRPSCLVISPSLSDLSLFYRISLQLTKCHTSEGGLISPASQTF